MAELSEPERQAGEAQRYRRLFDSNIVGVIVADTHGNITAANDFFLTMVGYERADLPLRWDAMTPSDWRQQDEAKIRELTATGTGIPWEKEYFRKDGSRVPILVGVVLLDEARGTCIGIALDLSERKRDERRLLEHKKRLRAVSTELTVVEERERRRIARGIHDEISQSLAMAKVRLGELREDPATADARSLEEVRQLVDSAIRASRSLTFELSSPLLYEMGIEAALENLAEVFGERHGLQVDFEADPQPKKVTETIAVLLYRAVRELLWNVKKHAGAQKVCVSVEWSSDRVRITVEDDGAGFEASAASGGFGRDGGFGLFSLHERLTHVGGGLDVNSAVGKGARVVVAAPLSARLDGGGDSQ